MSTVYRIAKWNEVFERAESRKLKTLSWVSVPTSFSSSGYQSLLDEFGDDSAAIYGAWCALVCFAASCTVRGTLATSRGTPIKVGHIARATGLRSTVFDQLFAWATKEDIAWLIPAQPDEIPQNSAVFDDSGESPESSGEVPDYRTRQDRTQPDQTQHYRTGPDQTQRPVQSGPVVTFEFGDRDVLRDRAVRLDKAAAGKISSDLIWQVVCLDSVTKNGLLGSIREDFIGGKVRKPVNFVQGAIARCCEEHSIDQKEFVKKMPPRKLANKGEGK